MSKRFDWNLIISQNLMKKIISRIEDKQYADWISTKWKEGETDFAPNLKLTFSCNRDFELQDASNWPNIELNIKKLGQWHHRVVFQGSKSLDFGLMAKNDRNEF